MGILRFTVEIKFHDDIVDDNEINEVGQNIALGLKQQADGMGLAPEASETFTDEISVFKDGELVAHETMYLTYKN